MCSGAWLADQSLERVGADVAAGDDHSYALAGELTAQLLRCGDPCRARRLDYQSGIAEQRAHPFDHLGVADVHHVVNSAAQFVHRACHGHTHGDAVSDSGDALGRHKLRGVPRELHRGRALRHHADDPSARRGSAHPYPDARHERAVTERYEERVDGIVHRRQLDRDRARTLRDGGDGAVLDEQRAHLLRVSACGFFGRVEILAFEHDLRAEAAHAVDLDRARVDGCENGDAMAALARRVRHALSEVAGAGADEAARGNLDAVHQVVGAASFEGANGVEAFDFEDGGDAEARAERLALVLRRMQEDRVDDLGGLRDPLDRNGLMHGQERSFSFPRAFLLMRDTGVYPGPPRLTAPP